MRLYDAIGFIFNNLAHPVACTFCGIYFRKKIYIFLLKSQNLNLSSCNCVASLKNTNKKINGVFWVGKKLATTTTTTTIATTTQKKTSNAKERDFDLPAMCNQLVNSSFSAVQLTASARVRDGHISLQFFHSLINFC